MAKPLFDNEAAEMSQHSKCCLKVELCSLELAQVQVEWLVWVKGAKFARHYKQFELMIRRAGLFPESFVFFPVPWCLAIAAAVCLAGIVRSVLDLKCLFSGLNCSSFIKVDQNKYMQWEAHRSNGATFLCLVKLRQHVTVVSRSLLCAWVHAWCAKSCSISQIFFWFWVVGGLLSYIKEGKMHGTVEILVQSTPCWTSCVLREILALTSIE